MKNNSNTDREAAPVPAGISTACFYPRYTEESLRLLAEQKTPPECVEIFVNAEDELRPDYLRELRSIADDAGIRIASIHPYTCGMEHMYFFSEYDRRFDEGLRVYRGYYTAAQLLGAEIVVFHGAARVCRLEYEEYAERFHRVWQDARANGAELCHENVQRCVGYCPRFFSEMSRLLPHVNYVLDTKQAVRAGVDVFDFVRAMYGHIRHIHISDYGEAGDCLVPGTGVLNIPRLLSDVTRGGFDGSVIVELYRENFDSPVEIIGGYQHVSTALSTVCHNP